jgi:hypothetical protein
MWRIIINSQWTTVHSLDKSFACESISTPGKKAYKHIII